MMIHTLLNSFLCWSVLLTVCFSWCTAVCADDDVREYKVKAAFILNFSKLTTWPEETFTQPAQTFDFCVAGDDPFGTALDGVESKQVGGRNVRLHYVSSISEVQTCHVLFVSKSEQADLGQLEPITDERPLITISDIPGFSRQGGMFEFVTKDGRLSFIINNQVATQNGLQISASLLNLAVEVL